MAQLIQPEFLQWTGILQQSAKSGYSVRSQKSFPAFLLAVEMWTKIRTLVSVDNETIDDKSMDTRAHLY